ncbi:hypothetical protein QE364_002441 [Nocardioides zeae]|uniref:Uncharacterized protein n=1 Tax=Nocardioides zeae TaxID=1457234 RepID=A0ACC6IIW1_9ACTN|nr:CoA transferase [Nocardioides zeae]MDR6174657.1 hypothetical protein [Nocardioides zeae]MDR6210726.1 hypothetical protein [Nocardioides zeae]
MSAPVPDLAGWAASGALHLTGRADGPPVLGPGDPAGRVAADLATVAAHGHARAARTEDSGERLPGVGVLGERAALLGLTRSGPASCGGAFRTVPTTDGWFGLSLARDDDVALVPALVERPLDDAVGADDADDAWRAVRDWARALTRAEAAGRAALLGLPHAAWPPLPADHREPVETLVGGRRSRVGERPLVVDLSALWAGPLCAHLLGLTGCTVVKVEDPRRPDGARRAPGRFFDLLHAGHDSVGVRLAGDGPGRLLDLLLRADLVIESSRPRALRQHGIVAEELVAAGVSWLSITARGRASDTVGFGDDVAVAGGLAVEDRGQLLPVGDAIADPLTGVRAAAAAAAALAQEHAALLDVSMLHVVRSCLVPAVPPPHVVRRSASGWDLLTDGARHAVLPPRSRQPAGTAAPLGRHDDRWWP